MIMFSNFKDKFLAPKESQLEPIFGLNAWVYNFIDRMVNNLLSHPTGSHFTAHCPNEVKPMIRKRLKDLAETWNIKLEYTGSEGINYTTNDTSLIQNLKKTPDEVKPGRSNVKWLEASVSTLTDRITESWLQALAEYHKNQLHQGPQMEPIMTEEMQTSAVTIVQASEAAKKFDMEKHMVVIRNRLNVLIDNAFELGHTSFEFKFNSKVLHAQAGKELKEAGFKSSAAMNEQNEIVMTVDLSDHYD